MQEIFVSTLLWVTGGFGAGEHVEAVLLRRQSSAWRTQVPAPTCCSSTSSSLDIQGRGRLSFGASKEGGPA